MSCDNNVTGPYHLICFYITIEQHWWCYYLIIISSILILSPPTAFGFSLHILFLLVVLKTGIDSLMLVGGLCWEVLLLYQLQYCLSNNLINLVASQCISFAILLADDVILPTYLKYFFVLVLDFLSLHLPWL